MYVYIILYNYIYRHICIYLDHHIHVFRTVAQRLRQQHQSMEQQLSLSKQQLQHAKARITSDDGDFIQERWGFNMIYPLVM